MTRKRVLLLMDFSRSGYAAHHAVLKMHAYESLHVVLLLVGPHARLPVSALVRQFADLMANAHISRGATADVVIGGDDVKSAVRRMLSCEGFGLVVAGECLAECQSRDDLAWLLVDSAGGTSRRGRVRAPQAAPTLSDGPSRDLAAPARTRRARTQSAALVAATGIL